MEAKIITIGGLLFSSFLHLDLQTIWGGINAVQIIAHLPLNNVNFPLNAQMFYYFLTRVISFDFFAPTDYFDFGFTSTEPYSSAYEWLGYETTNFYENIGSVFVIGIIIALRQILQPIVFWILNRLKCRCCDKF